MALRSFRGVVDEVGVELSCFGAVTPGAGADEEETVLVVVDDSGFARSEEVGLLPVCLLPFALAYPFPADGVDVPPVLPTPILFSSSRFKLCISWFNSPNFASPFAFQLSNAFGICSLKPLICS